jgi:hypothetical protein
MREGVGEGDGNCYTLPTYPSLSLSLSLTSTMAHTHSLTHPLSLTYTQAVSLCDTYGVRHKDKAAQQRQHRSQEQNGAHQVCPPSRPCQPRSMHAHARTGTYTLEHTHKRTRRNTPGLSFSLSLSLWYIGLRTVWARWGSVCVCVCVCVCVQHTVVADE